MSSRVISKRKHVTVALRARTAVKKSALPPSRPRTDIAQLPNEYALKVVGDCLAPIVPHGAEAVFSKTAKFENGDIVVVWFNKFPAGGFQCCVKRVVLGPGAMTIPFKVHPDSEVHPIVVLETLQPPKQFAIQLGKIAAMHKFVRLQGAAVRS